MSEQDKVDLQKLSQRELLIVMHERLKGIGDSVKDLLETQAKHEVRLSLIENRVLIFGGIFGLLGAAALELIISIFA